jgi:hypothetical protein
MSSEEIIATAGSLQDLLMPIPDEQLCGWQHGTNRR